MGKWKSLTPRERVFVWIAGALGVVAAITTVGWLNSYPPMATDWAVASGVSTALGTFLLAFFAWKAWRAALGTINAQANSDQISALAEYVKALNSLSRVSPFSYPNLPLDQYVLRDRLDAIHSYKARLLELSQQVESTATIWRAHHKTVGGEMAAFAEAEHFLIESIEWWRGDTDCPQVTVKEQHGLWAAFAKDLGQLATHWQVNEQERSKNANRVASTLERYFVESPLLSESLEGYEPVTKKADMKRRKRRSK